MSKVSLGRCVLDRAPLTALLGVLFVLPTTISRARVANTPYTANNSGAQLWDCLSVSYSTSLSNSLLLYYTTGGRVEPGAMNELKNSVNNYKVPAV